MRIIIKTIFTIEKSIPPLTIIEIENRFGKVEEEQAKAIRRQDQNRQAAGLMTAVRDPDVQALMTKGAKEALFLIESRHLEGASFAGPTFDIHKIHEPEIDGPKPDVSGEPDAVDPIVTITDADGSSVE